MLIPLKSIEKNIPAAPKLLVDVPT
jgi:hypothetical protein